MHNFADNAAPLHQLTQKGTPFHWDAQRQEAFNSLKMALTQAPILAFPKFMSSASPFSLQTNASAVGVCAVLEQGGHVIAYASRSLTPAE